jgi:fumarate reductase flavoprotein subunit
MRNATRIGWWSLVALLAIGWSVGSWAAGNGPLADRHRGAGIECTSCHTEKPPAQAVESATCIACHGAYAALAAKTEKTHPNPHASHQGELPCESCHHVHARSVDYCSQCHDFGYKVP